MTASSSPKTILLIGGAGFIGTVLAQLLRDQGHRVIILDKDLTGVTSADAVLADIRDPHAIRPHFDGVDIVINLAAEHRDDVRPLSLYQEVNVDGSAHICQAAAEAGVRDIVFTSSVAVYGSSPQAMNEDQPHAYFNEYGRTKHLAEDVYRGWLNGGDDRRLCIVRPTVVFGPGNRGNVFNLLRQIKYGPFLMVGDGLNRKSLCHVRNVAGFIASRIGAGERYGLYNYADKPDRDMNALVTLAQSALGRKTRMVRLPLWLGLMLGHVADGVAAITRRSLPISAVRVQKFTSNSIIDSSKAMATGYVPPVSLDDGLADMLRNHV